MSASKQHDRENDFAVQMQERKNRFLAIDANIRKQHALSGNLVRKLEQMPTVNYAAGDGQEMAHMQRLHADTSNAIAATENLFQTRNAMVFADKTAAAKTKPAGKVIANIDLTHSDLEPQVVEDSDSDDDVQIVGQRAVL